MHIKRTKRNGHSNVNMKRRETVLLYITFRTFFFFFISLSIPFSLLHHRRSDPFALSRSPLDGTCLVTHSQYSRSVVQTRVHSSVCPDATRTNPPARPTRVPIPLPFSRVTSQTGRVRISLKQTNTFGKLIKRTNTKKRGSV